MKIDALKLVVETVERLAKETRHSDDDRIRPPPCKPSGWTVEPREVMPRYEIPNPPDPPAPASPPLPTVREGLIRRFKACMDYQKQVSGGYVGWIVIGAMASEDNILISDLDEILKALEG